MNYDAVLVWKVCMNQCASVMTHDYAFIPCDFTFVAPFLEGMLYSVPQFAKSFCATADISCEQP